MTSDPLPLGRTLVVAPHPDDDAIAAGGLIQRAVAAGGEVRVVFITDGEANPWPQRFMERKPLIMRKDRERWGAMRRGEALCSLEKFGISARGADFLGMPDQRIAALARRGDTQLPESLRAIVEEFRPTLIVSPSALDLHSDHRAIAWFVHRAATHHTIITYLVHGRGPAERRLCDIELTERERLRKRSAIECHASQLFLSRERFLAHARPVETYYKAEHDLVRLESRLEGWLRGWRHVAHVVFGSLRVQSAADVEHRAGDVAGLL